MTPVQRTVLTVAILASLVAFLDGSVVNVALPAIERELGGGLALQQWVVDAYLITLGALILLAGSLSDAFGRLRILQAGLAVFGLASLVCAVAPSPLWLVAARAVQGVGGALLVPSSLALIIEAFDEDDQPRAIGRWTAWTSVAQLAGPLLGGVFVDALSWRWVFAINLAPLAVTLVLLRRLPREERQARVPVDYPGAVLGALGLGGVVFALIEQAGAGWGSPSVWGVGAVGGASLIAFVVVERRSAHPMLPLGLFRVRNFGAGNLATLAIYAALSLGTLIVGLYLQEVAGFPATLAGLALIPSTLVMLALSGRVGALAGRWGPRWFMAAGPVIAAGGFALMLLMGAEVDYWTELLPGVVRLEPLAPRHVPGLRAASEGARAPFPASLADVPTPDGAEAFAARSLARAQSGQYLPFAQIDPRDGRVLGHTAYLSPRWFPGGRLLAVEVGSTWLTPAARGTAANSASKLVLFAWAFEEWGVARLDIKTDARNDRARAGIAAVGGRFEGVLRSWQPSAADGEDGRPRDTAMFSITADEWPEARRALEERVARKRAAGAPAGA